MSVWVLGWAVKWVEMMVGKTDWRVLKKVCLMGLKGCLMAVLRVDYLVALMVGVKVVKMAVMMAE